MSITSQPPENGFAPWSLMGPSQGSSPSKSPPKANLIQLEPKAADQMPVKSESAEASDGLSFGDFLDVINPLQHIPVVSTIYREITGDDIGAPARIAGGTLFGGVIGLAAGVINSVVDDSSGKDVGEHIVSALTGDQNPKVPNTKTTDSESANSVASANIQIPAQTQTPAILPKESSQPNPTITTSEASKIPAQVLPNDLQQGPTLEQIAALNMASQDKMEIIAEVNPKISDHVVPLSGPMADKLRAISTGAGGLNLSHMPGAAATNPAPQSPTMQKQVALKVEETIPLQEGTSRSFRLSDDVRKQLDHIGKIQQERSVLSLQEKSPPQVKPVVEEKTEVKPIIQPKAAPQIAAYESAKSINQASNSGQSIEISEAMMNALQKYDNLLNGRKIN